MLTLPASITRETHFYLYLKTPTGGPSAFDYRIKDDPEWLYLFSHTIEIPVPEGTLEAVMARVPEHFAEARRQVQAEAGAKLNYFAQLESKFLALEA